MLVKGVIAAKHGELTQTRPKPFARTGLETQAEHIRFAACGIGYSMGCTIALRSKFTMPTRKGNQVMSNDPVYLLKALPGLVP